MSMTLSCIRNMSNVNNPIVLTQLDIYDFITLGHKLKQWNNDYIAAPGIMFTTVYGMHSKCTCRC
jgi:hypothetical protein